MRIATERDAVSLINTAPDEDLATGDQVLVLSTANQLAAARHLLLGLSPGRVSGHPKLWPKTNGVELRPIPGMTYAIVQKELVVPNVDEMKRAFCSLEGLTSLDAQAAANDAYGILLRGLDPERAGALQAALNYEGVATEIVSETDLPLIPTAKVVRRVQFEADHLLGFDSMQRATSIPYAEILFIAAGQVHTRETRPTGLTYDNIISLRSREEEHDCLFIDLFLLDGVRFTITVNEFNFDHLGERTSDETSVNYLALIQELEEHAPGASLNRGAFLACQAPPELFSYPSRHAYQEEIVWVLWRIQKLMTAPTTNGD